MDPFLCFLLGAACALPLTVFGVKVFTRDELFARVHRLRNRAANRRRRRRLARTGWVVLPR